MLSVDTNIIVRPLTGDDRTQFREAKALFAHEEIFIATAVVLECEWVLRYAYEFNRTDIQNAFQALFGLPNVEVQDPAAISDAIDWYREGMNFADAIHLAQSKEAAAFVTFVKKLMKTAMKISAATVRTP